MEKSEAQFFATAPPKMSKAEAFKLFLWNKETKEVLGRSGSSWAKILIFYIILYAFLAGFFAAMLVVFFQTLDHHQPKWQNSNGLIGTNPGLGFRPMPETNIESTLISFRHGANGDWNPWFKSLEKFLSPYDNVAGDGEHFTSCSFDKAPEPNKVCSFDIKLLGNACTKEELFGYERGRPCVILKLNKIFGWVPEVYNDTKTLPANMPKDLKEYIHELEAQNPNQLNMIWVSCEGENAQDVERLGNITYTPYRGFPAYYFPYRNTGGYLSPIIAIQFEKPETGVLINIECKVWAKNIIHDRQRRLGSVHFELMMD